LSQIPKNATYTETIAAGGTIEKAAIPIPINHVFYVDKRYTSDDADGRVMYFINGSEDGTVYYPDSYPAIYTQHNNISLRVRLYNAGATAKIITFSDVNVQVIDLTEAFGSGNEPSTVEEFKAIFPEDYYAFTLGEILSALVNKIVSKDSESVEIAAKTIPQAILDLPGYGWSAGTAFNEIDWENKKYIQRVGSYTISGSEAFTQWGDAYFARCLSDSPAAVSNSTVNTTSNRFESESTDSLYSNTTTAAVGARGERLYMSKKAYEDGNYAGTVVYYALETSIETDISALLDDNHIQVESGGSITFENTNGDSYRIPVPSTVLTAQQGA
jgi:hypothetical protein